MDPDLLVQLLRATLSPEQRQEAEAQLRELQTVTKFAPGLLRVISEQSIDLPVRQAAAIYLKNLCSQVWENCNKVENTEIRFTIQEADKAEVRDHIVEALIQAPEPIRVQLAECVRLLVKFDFPKQWPEIAEKARHYLESNQQETWTGAILCIYQLAKNFSSKTSGEPHAMKQAMSVLLPLCFDRLVQLMPDESEGAVLLQKQILKIFRALIRYFLPVDLITEQMFRDWIGVLLQVVSRPVPPQQNQVDEHDRPQLAWWKAKKWAMCILLKLSGTYAYRGQKREKYKTFSEFYNSTFSEYTIQVLLEVLGAYREKQYVSPRVLLCAIICLHLASARESAWQEIGTHMHTIVPDVIFPLMTHSEDEDDLWQSDPTEYTRARFGREQLFSLTVAAQRFLCDAVNKSCDIFILTMDFITQLLCQEGLPPQQKTGVVYMLGSIAFAFTKYKYVPQAVNLMSSYVFMELRSDYGYLRATACWFMTVFHSEPHHCDTHLEQALQLVLEILREDREQMVRIQAGQAISSMLANQFQAKDILWPHIVDIIKYVLDIINQTEDFEPMKLMDLIICRYNNNIVPILVDICMHLANTFGKLVESNEEWEKRVKASKSTLATLDTLMTVIEDNPDALLHVEGIILSIVRFIFEHSADVLYDDTFSLLQSVTAYHISPGMWQTFGMFYEFVKTDKIVDHFPEVMPILYNHVNVDPKGFTSDPRHLEIVCNSSHMILTNSHDEEALCEAAKLLEVVLLLYKGQVDSVVPSFFHLGLAKLMSDDLGDDLAELRVSYLQVLIAALYNNPVFVLSTMNTLPTPESSQTYIDMFVTEWMKNMSCFKWVHGRKLCVLGLCCLLEAPPELRPPCLLEYADKVIPSIIKMLKCLNHRYSKVASSFSRTDYEDKGENECKDEDTDEDEHNEMISSAIYDTPLDVDDCPIDEFQVFKEVLLGIQEKDPHWFSVLTSPLTSQQHQEVEEIIRLAGWRKACDSALVTSTGKDIQQGTY